MHHIRRLSAFLAMLCGIVLCAILTGCTTAQAVPKASFKWNPKTGDVEIISPKDSELSNTIITRGETNGMKFFQIQIGTYRTSMNPEVIKESAAGTAQIISATSRAAVETFLMGLQAAQATAKAAAPVPIPKN